MSDPRVVGLDLSITATGISDQLGECSTCGGPSKLGDRRLAAITSAIEEMLTVHGEVCDRFERVDLVVIEDIPTHAHGAGITGMVHGAVRLRLLDWAIPYVLVPPASLKKYATGKGNASKADMAVALYKRAGLELADDNQVDAWWLRALGLQLLGDPIVELPALNLSALDRLELPAGVS